MPTGHRGCSGTARCFHFTFFPSLLRSSSFASLTFTLTPIHSPRYNPRLLKVEQQEEGAIHLPRSGSEDPQPVHLG